MSLTVGERERGRRSNEVRSEAADKSVKNKIAISSVAAAAAGKTACPESRINYYYDSICT